MKALTLSLSSPYVGLRPFDAADALLFFGRGRNVDELLAKLVSGPRFLAVLGASGTGKSSMVRAGLMPALHRGAAALPGIRRWNIITVKPGKAPMANLAKGLMKLESLLGDFTGEQAADQLAARLSESPRSLVDQFTSTADRHPGEALLVFVDQFEEIFRYRQKDINEAEAFVKLLLRSATEPGVPIYVVVTMRADFLDRAVAFKQLPEAINKGLYLTPRLDIDELESVITSPLRLVNGSIRPELTARLLNDLGGEDDLPVLQHALLRMWDEARKNERSEITMDDYRLVCRLRDAKPVSQGSPLPAHLQASIDNHATQLYAKLSPGAQAVARTLFVALVAESETRQVRRELPWPELLGQVGAEHEDDCLAVLNAYRDDGVGFLLPDNRTKTLDDDSVIDIAHESLFRQWHMLQGWLKDEADNLDKFRDYQKAVLKCETGQGGLLGDLQCAEAHKWLSALQARGGAERWAARHVRPAKAFSEPVPGVARERDSDPATVPFAKVEAYIHESKQGIDAAAEAEHRRLLRELETEKDMARLKAVSFKRIVYLAAGLFCVSVVATVLALQSSRSEAQAERNYQEALKQRQVASEANEKSVAYAKTAASQARHAAQKASEAVSSEIRAQQEAGRANLAASAARGAERQAQEAKQEALLQKAVSKSRDVWLWLASLGEQGENTKIPLGLLSVARSELPVRQSLLDEMLTDPDKAAKFNENSSAVLKASIGTSPQMHAWLRAEIARRRGATPQPSNANVARALKLADSYTAKPAFDALVEELETASRSGRVLQLGRELAEVVRADPAQAQARAFQLERLLRSNTRSDVRQALATALAASLPFMPQPQLRVVATGLIAAARDGRSPSELSELRNAFDNLADKLGDEDRVALLGELLAASQGASREQGLTMAHMAAVLVKTASKPLPETVAVLQQLRLGAKATTWPQDLTLLADTFVQASQRLTEEGARTLLPTLLADWQSVTDTDQMRALVTAIAAVGKLIPSAEARAQTERLTAALPSPTVRQLGDLTKILAALGTRMQASDADELLKPVIERWEQADGNRRQRSDAAVLDAFVPKASRGMINRVANRLASTLEQPRVNWTMAQDLGGALDGAPLEPQRAHALVATLLAKLDTELDADSDRAASRTAILLASNLDAQTATRLLDDMLNRPGGTKRWRDSASQADMALRLLERAGQQGAASARKTLALAQESAKALSRLPLPFLFADLDLGSRNSLLLQALGIGAGSRQSSGSLFGGSQDPLKLIATACALLPEQEIMPLLREAVDRFSVPGAEDGTRASPVLAAIIRGLAARPELAQSPEFVPLLLSHQNRGAAVRPVLAEMLKSWADRLEPGPLLKTSVQQLSASVLEQTTSETPMAAEALRAVVKKLPAADVTPHISGWLEAFEAASAGARATLLAQLLETAYANVNAQEASRILPDLLTRASRSKDPDKIRYLGRMAVVLGKTLGDGPETARWMVEFLKYPSTPHADLLAVLRQAPPPGSGVPAMTVALQSRYGLKQELDLPAREDKR